VSPAKDRGTSCPQSSDDAQGSSRPSENYCLRGGQSTPILEAMIPPWEDFQLQRISSDLTTLKLNDKLRGSWSLACAVGVFAEPAVKS
jgi:hypothetical protein